MVFPPGFARPTETRPRGSGGRRAGHGAGAVVAAIGFVNASLLTQGQSLWVLFGPNVGTTITGWLVALVWLKFITKHVRIDQPTSWNQFVVFAAAFVSIVRWLARIVVIVAVPIGGSADALTQEIDENTRLGG